MTIGQISGFTMNGESENGQGLQLPLDTSLYMVHLINKNISERMRGPRSIQKSRMCELTLFLQTIFTAD